MSDLQQIVEVLTRTEVDALAAEQNPLFWYVRVSDAKKLLDEIDGLRKELAELKEWKERAAKFLNQLAEERKANDGSK